MYNTTEQIENYLDRLLKHIETPTPPEKPHTEDQHRDIENRYIKQLKINVKSYYDNKTKTNIIEFLNY